MNRKEWFDNNAQEAVMFYASIFKNSKIIRLHPLVSTFELDGQRLMALNGGPNFKFFKRVMQAMLKMVKLDIEALKQGYNG